MEKRIKHLTAAVVMLGVAVVALGGLNVWTLNRLEDTKLACDVRDRVLHSAYGTQTLDTIRVKASEELAQNLRATPR